MSLKYLSQTKKLNNLYITASYQLKVLQVRNLLNLKIQLLTIHSIKFAEIKSDNSLYYSSLVYSYHIANILHVGILTINLTY